MNMKEVLALEPTFVLGDGAAAPSAFDKLRDKLGIDDVVVKLGERGATALVGGAWSRPPRYE